jgi:hypothetical protein
VTERRGVAVVIRATYEYRDGGGPVDFLFGPFLPHRGSATHDVVSRLYGEAEDNPNVVSIDCTVEDVFIADGESDAVVIARDSL